MVWGCVHLTICVALDHTHSVASARDRECHTRGATAWSLLARLPPGGQHCIDLWVKGFLTMGLFCCIGSTFTLAKTILDNYEAERMANLLDAKTGKLRSDYDFRSS